MLEQQLLGRGRDLPLDLDVARNLDLADGFADLDELRGAGFGMWFEEAALGPAVRLVVMIDVAEQDARCGSVQDQSQHLC